MKSKDWQKAVDADYEARGRRKATFYSESKIELADVYDQAS